MSSHNSFNQPLNEAGAPPGPRQASDFLNEFRDWWIKVPLTSKCHYYYFIKLLTISML